MERNLLKILSASNKEIDNQKLMDYLSGHLGGDEAHDIEEKMLDDDLLTDAVEGLENLKNKNDALLFAEQLNRNLKKQLQKKNNQKQKRKFKDFPWLYISIILVLLVMVACFILILMHLRSAG